MAVLAVKAARFAEALHLFALADARSPADVDACLSDVQARLDAVAQRPANIVRITCSVSSQSEKDRVLAAFRQRRQGALAAVEVVLQPPLEAPMTMLVWAVSGEGVRVAQRDRAVEVSQPGARFLFVGGIETEHGEAGLDARLSASFQRYAEILRQSDFGVEDTIRFWLYIDEINAVVDGVENYQRANDARARFFRRFWSDERGRPLFPASTGVGVLAGGCTVSGFACHPAADVSTVGIENPRQVPAFRYPASESAVPPLFSRGIALVTPRDSLVFLSGTASIVGSQTVFPRSVVRQTEQTLENIQRLLATAGLADGAGGSPFSSLLTCQVYLRNAQDLAAVKSVCARSVPADLPIVFVRADLCRADLLVEIECVAAGAAAARG